MKSEPLCRSVPLGISGTFMCSTTMFDASTCIIFVSARRASIFATLSALVPVSHRAASCSPIKSVQGFVHLFLRLFADLALTFLRDFPPFKLPSKHTALLLHRDFCDSLLFSSLLIWSFSVDLFSPPSSSPSLLSLSSRALHHLPPHASVIIIILNTCLPP